MDLHVKNRHERVEAPKPSSRPASALSSLLRLLSLLTWSLWFGGMIALFLSVEALFTLRRPIAGDAASAIFLVFGRYQLVLGGLTLIFTVLYYGVHPSRKLIASFILFALGSILAVYLAALLIPHMEVLRQQYLTHSPDFARLHGLSMGLFTAETVLVLLGGIFLCLSIGSSTKHGA
jgi:hypothetical protein